MKLSEHFTLAELTTTSHSDLLEANKIYAQSDENIVKLQVLAETILEPLRAISGPLRVTSGVRCPELNTKVGGSATSQHCLCEAADVMPVSGGMSVEALYEAAKNSDIPFGQMILETSGTTQWIHISLGEPYRAKEKCKQAFKMNV